MNELLGGDQTQKFTSLYLVEQINVFRKQEKENSKELLHKSFLTKIKMEFEEEITGQKILLSEYKDQSGKKNKMYELNFEQSLQILMSESKFVRKAVIEVLKRQQQELNNLKPKLPTTYKEALLELVRIEEEKEQLLLENNNLNTVLDNLTDWISIIKVAQHNKVSEKVFNWRLLKDKSQELGYVIKKAESPRYGYQNLYHIDCFRALYPSLSYSFKSK